MKENRNALKGEMKLFNIRNRGEEVRKTLKQKMKNGKREGMKEDDGKNRKERKGERKEKERN